MDSSRSERRLQVLLLDHQSAVREFIARASALDAKHWLKPRAEGKWTPAQETKHVLMAYGEFTRQLRESTPMRMHRSRVRRLLSRAIGLTSILWFKRIPVAVNAPREVRPDWIAVPASQLLPELQQRADEFDAQFEDRWRNEPQRRMTHYLFGRITLDQGMRLVTVHTRHHAAFLPSPQ